MPCNCKCNDNNGCFPPRMAVKLTRIFDGAQNTRRLDVALPLSSFTPQPVSPPLNFISAFSSGPAVVTSVIVGNEVKCRRRIVVNYTFPVTVTYTDSAGRLSSATSTISETEDLLLTIPDCNYSVDVCAEFISRIGIIDDSVATVKGCLRTIVRILTECDAIINTCELNYPQARLTDVNCTEVFD